MPNFKGKVIITFKPGINDPQAISVEEATHNLGYINISNLISGKIFYFSIDATSLREAKNTGKELCEKLLSNSVIENYELTVDLD
tara:strand:+ start:231 stop:485 length:255 start_codon:yes stop_codon:yes gene_type:complete